MIYALFFLLGVFVNRLGHIILQIKPMQQYWKSAEYGALKVLAEAEVLRYQALAILEISYNDVNKQEEFKLVKEVINKMHNEQQTLLINRMRDLLPYQTSYNTPQEAYKVIEQIAKNGEQADE